MHCSSSRVCRISRVPSMQISDFQRHLNPTSTFQVNFLVRNRSFYHHLFTFSNEPAQTWKLCFFFSVLKFRRCLSLFCKVGLQKFGVCSIKGSEKDKLYDPAVKFWKTVSCNWASRCSVGFSDTEFRYNSYFKIK